MTSPRPAKTAAARSPSLSKVNWNSRRKDTMILFVVSLAGNSSRLLARNYRATNLLKAGAAAINATTRMKILQLPSLLIRLIDT